MRETGEEHVHGGAGKRAAAAPPARLTHHSQPAVQRPGGPDVLGSSSGGVCIFPAASVQFQPAVASVHGKCRGVLRESVVGARQPGNLRREIILLGPHGDDLVFRFRVRAADLRVDQPQLHLPNAMRKDRAR